MNQLRAAQSSSSVIIGNGGGSGQQQALPPMLPTASSSYSNANALSSLFSSSPAQPPSSTSPLTVMGLGQQQQHPTTLGPWGQPVQATTTTTTTSPSANNPFAMWFRIYPLLFLLSLPTTVTVYIYTLSFLFFFLYGLTLLLPLSLSFLPSFPLLLFFYSSRQACAHTHFLSSSYYIDHFFSLSLFYTLITILWLFCTYLYARWWWYSLSSSSSSTSSILVLWWFFLVTLRIRGRWRENRDHHHQPDSGDQHTHTHHSFAQISLQPPPHSHAHSSATANNLGIYLSLLLLLFITWLATQSINQFHTQPPSTHTHLYTHNALFVFSNLMNLITNYKFFIYSHFSTLLLLLLPHLLLIFIKTIHEDSKTVLLSGVWLCFAFPTWKRTFFTVNCLFGKQLLWSCVFGFWWQKVKGKEGKTTLKQAGIFAKWKWRGRVY